MFWKRLKESLLASRAEVDAQTERAALASLNVATIAQVQDREVVTVAGVVRTTTLQPRDGTVKTEVELYDGTGSLKLVWLGQRVVAGVNPGIRLRAHGRVAVRRGDRILFNPTYELLPRDIH